MAKKSSTSKVTLPWTITDNMETSQPSSDLGIGLVQSRIKGFQRGALFKPRKSVDSLPMKPEGRILKPARKPSLATKPRLSRYDENNLDAEVEIVSEGAGKQNGVLKISAQPCIQSGML